MRKTFTLIMAVLAIHFATAQKLVGTYYDWNKIHPKEQYYVNSAGQKNGTYKMYDQNGVVIKEYNYLNGVENGTCNEYAALPGNQRVVKTKMNFKNGEADGAVVQYCEYDNYKSKVQEGKYLSGKKTGLWREWWCTEIYDDKFYGFLKSVGSYKNDMMDGQWTFYTNRGLKEKSGTYKNGVEHGMWFYYSPDDSTKIISQGEFALGKRTGLWKVYLDNSLSEVNEPAKASFYQMKNYTESDELADTLETIFYTTGEIAITYQVVKEKVYMLGIVTNRQGTYNEYFKNGKILCKGQYSRNKRFGDWKYYYENGIVSEEGSYNNDGQRKEDWKSYYESGKIQKVSNYGYGSGTSLKFTEYDENGTVTKSWDSRW